MAMASLRALSFRRMPSTAPRPPTLIRVYSDIPNDSYWTIAVTSDTTARSLCDIIATKTGEDDYFMLFLVSKGRFSKKSEVPLGGNEIIMDVDHRERKKDKNYKFLARMISRTSGSPVQRGGTIRGSLPVRRGHYSTSANNLISSVHRPGLFDSYSLRSVHAAAADPSSPDFEQRVRYSLSSSELTGSAPVMSASIYTDQGQVERTEVVTSTTITPNYTVTSTSTTTITRSPPSPLNITPPSPLNITPPSPLQRPLKSADGLENAIVVRHNTAAAESEIADIRISPPSPHANSAVTTTETSFLFTSSTTSVDNSLASPGPPRSTTPPSADLSTSPPNPFSGPRARSALLPNRNSKRHSASPQRF